MNSGKTAYSGLVFKIIVINVIIFAIQIFAQQYQVVYSLDGFNGSASAMNFYLGLTPAVIIEKGYIWQIFSYMFLHNTSGFMHIFFNMYALLIFGIPIEQEWGSKRFLIYYLACGTGAGLCIFIINLISMNIGYFIPTIGASGAVFGLLLAFGILFPDAELLLFFVLPIKAKYLVLLYGGIELYLELFGGQSPISHIGHLGGLLTGLIFFLVLKKKNISFKSKMMKAKFAKDIKHQNAKSDELSKRIDHKNRDKNLDILKKVQTSGPESLTDDEVQLINYIDIMTEETDEAALCDENDLDISDEHCKNCEHFNACFLREVKKHL